MAIKKLRSLTCGLFALLLVWSTASSADQIAQARVDVNLRAGPNRDYPVVAVLSAGSMVTVLGCLGDYSWCDVQSPPYRGWVYANNLLITQTNGNQATLNAVGAVVGIGITSFIINSYWRDHYYNQPWYGNMNVWVARPPHYHRPPGYYPPPAYRPPPPPAYRPPPPAYRPPPPAYRPPPPPAYRPPPPAYRPPPPPPAHRPPHGGGGSQGGGRPPPPQPR